MDRYQKLIPLKWTLNPFPSAVIENNITLTQPEEIAYTFKKYFLDISSTSQSTIKFSRNKFHEFLPDRDTNSFFINPGKITEIKIIVLSLNLLKVVAPNSIAKKSWNNLATISQTISMSYLIFPFHLVFFSQS